MSKKAPRKAPNKQVIGSVEWCAFPELGIPAIKARVDSGAKTSSMHAFNIHTFDRDGATWVNFEVHPLQKNKRVSIVCERPVIDERSVKSSTGIAEARIVIASKMTLGGDQWDIELTLANRDSMGFRMLLGREAMGDRILIDPSRSFCLGEISASKMKAIYAKP